MLAGSPGGTVIVIRSKNFRAKSFGSTNSFNLLIRIAYEMIERQNKKPMNLAD